MTDYHRRARIKMATAFLLFLGGVAGFCVWWQSGGPYRKYRSVSPESKPKEKISYTVTPLVDGDYLPSLISDIESAKRSICVAMFVMDAGRWGHGEGPVDQIVNALGAAARRGVRIVVKLDASESSRHKSEGLDMTVFESNGRNKRRLDEAGVRSELIVGRHELHDKMVIIDDRIFYIGAHNWTYAALSMNYETSLRVEASPHVPAVMNEYYKSIRVGETTWE